jgi:hypothetical protein
MGVGEKSEGGNVLGELMSLVIRNKWGTETLQRLGLGKNRDGSTKCGGKESITISCGGFLTRAGQGRKLEVTERKI